MLTIQSKLSISKKELDLDKYQNKLQNFKVITIKNPNNTLVFLPIVVIYKLPSLNKMSVELLPSNQSTIEYSFEQERLKFELDSLVPSPADVRKTTKTINELARLNIDCLAYIDEVLSLWLSIYSIDKIKTLLKHLPYSCTRAFTSRANLNMVNIEFIKKIDSLKELHKLVIKYKQVGEILPYVSNLTSLTIEANRSYLKHTDLTRLNCLEKLTIIDNSYETWKFQPKCPNLKYLKVTSNNIRILDLNHLIRLNKLKISDCKQLKDVIRIQNPTLITDLIVCSAYKLELIFIKELVNLKSLKVMFAGNNKKLILDKLFYLEHLHINSTNWIPEYLSFRELISLRSLELIDIDCETLPVFSALEQLQTIKICILKLLTVFPSLKKVAQLKELSIRYCNNLAEIPHLEQNARLENIIISDCKKIIELPSLDAAKEIKRLSFYKIKVKRLPTLASFKQLDRLTIGMCDDLEDYPSFNHLSKLSKLNMYMNTKASCLIEKIDQLIHLRFLSIQNCKGLEDFLNRTTKLEELHLEGNEQITTNLKLRDMKKLKKLSLNYWNLEIPPYMDNLQNLTELYFSVSENLQRIDSLDQTPNLTRLTIMRCPNFSSIHSIDSVDQFEKEFPAISLFWGRGSVHSISST